MALASNVTGRQWIVRKIDSRCYTKNWLYPSCFTPSEEAMKPYLPRRPPAVWYIFVGVVRKLHH